MIELIKEFVNTHVFPYALVSALMSLVSLRLIINSKLLTDWLTMFSVGGLFSVLMVYSQTEQSFSVFLLIICLFLFYLLIIIMEELSIFIRFLLFNLLVWTLHNVCLLIWSYYNA